ncbi:hypothetical protein HHI36_009058 [Cryptolaemus montrouzieri]|uniref:Peroxisomal membrane protein PEX14 n=1 Tax=Cryptolaemus montrouzieri TaxID=559131 RepID=A0ABD2MU71_9CUCU
MANNSGTEVEPENFVQNDLVKTAVSFLQNPRVVDTPLAQKQKFLRRKGLTDEEIERACELSGAYKQQHEQQLIRPPLPPLHINRNQMQLTFFEKLREIIHSMAIFSIVGYALYKIYENYIAPFLFENSVNELKRNLDDVKIEVDRIGRSSDRNTEKQLSEIKSDISTVKGLLLGRKQFPNVSYSPIVPPSIPAWQMASVQDAADGDVENKTEELEDMGSGSGSSEPEHYTKTSESSLEIISSPNEYVSSQMTGEEYNDQ